MTRFRNWSLLTTNSRAARVRPTAFARVSRARTAGSLAGGTVPKARPSTARAQVFWLAVDPPPTTVGAALKNRVDPNSPATRLA
jgi:hypothetical protein